ncbi:ribosomal RNA small subunit methyltransferase H [Clostridia bacterium]|nr:ribosomal RNA small subunit methyltransferase H [Clostridia bacterium]
MTGGGFVHIPVMLEPTVDALNVRAGGVYADGTLGGGGHSERIAQAGGRVIGIDRDAAAIAAARERLAPYDATLINDNFFNIKEILKSLSIDTIDGAVLDLGVSSHQLDTPERGFSYRFDVPLDMRMDRRGALTASEIVNEYDTREIERILFAYGEEQYARRIAYKIGERRGAQQIKTTFELVDIIKSAIPAKALRDKHPAKKTFQAIRIAVNGELSGLDRAVRDFCDVLKSGGRLAVITFHSLEDRIVKTAFASLVGRCDCPRDLPVCVCGKQPMVSVVTKKPATPSEDELSLNPRAASAKLRVIEKI